jgi:methanethiol S-methyltransferase
MNAILETGFLWILLACAVYGAIHSVLAANGTKAWVKRTFGEQAYGRFYRLFFSLMGGVTFLPLLALAALLPDRQIYAIPAPWSVLAVLLQVAAITAIGMGVLQTGGMRFIGIEQVLHYMPQKSAPIPEKLVTGGLYRLVRHPLYTFSFVLLWLNPLMSWNILALNIGLSAYMLVGSVFEERKLVEQFGQAYVEYQKNTPRIVPGIKLSR